MTGEARQGRGDSMRRGVLWRLRHDASGNAIALAAAALVPTIAAAGAAIDMSRYYLVRVRMQQACDAGVLAGRKFMDSAQAQLDPNATTQARRFFGNNFTAGWLGTSDVAFTPARSQTDPNVVTGTASATTPPVIMHFFGSAPVTQTISCAARFDVADADIMFVLDTTGSMACTPADPATCTTSAATYTRSDNTTGYYSVEKPGSKLSALRSAVQLFYDTLDANKDPSTNIRYGFVTYTSASNVGHLLKPEWIDSDQYEYQTRQLIGDANSGNPTSRTSIGVAKASCDAQAGRTPRTGYDGNSRATVVTTSWTSTNSGTCQVSTQTVQPNWQYGRFPLDVSAYVRRDLVQNPTRVTTSTSRWQGCVEERIPQTGEPQSGFTISNLPPSLDPDLEPRDDATKWRAAWPDVVWARSTSPTWTTTSDTYSWGDAGQRQSGSFSCGMPAQRLSRMTSAEVANFVNNNDFRAHGGTYHDIGMAWGLRLISPTGLFKDDTAAWPNRNPPNRHIVFMTDGNMAPNTDIYGFTGIERFDQRISRGSFGSLTDYHNARFAALCAAAKARNITVWTIVFGKGGAMTPTMQNCASPGKAFYTETAAELQTTFRQIATQIAQLRLSQ